MKEPEVHIPTAGECRAQGQILNGDKCVETTWSENPKEKVEDLANKVVDINTNMVDNIGGDAAHLINKIPGVEVDPKSLQPSSYGTCGKYVALAASGGLLWWIGHALYTKLWKRENADGTTNEGGLANCVPDCVGKPCKAATDKVKDCTGGVTGWFSATWRSFKAKCTYVRSSSWFWPGVIAALSALVWFLPALAALAPGSVQTMLAPATGLINQGKGAILGMTGMAPSGPLLGTP